MTPQEILEKDQIIRERLAFYNSAVGCYWFLIALWLIFFKTVFFYDKEVPTWVLVLGLPIIFVGKGLLQFSREEWQLRSNFVQSWTDDRPFFLFLRSFSNPALQEQIQRAGRTADRFSFFEYLDNAISHLGRIVFIGGQLSYVRMVAAPAPRAVVLMCKDEQWRSALSILASRSRAIILLPQSSAGVLEEAGFLRDSGLYRKTIIAMPPENRFDKSKNLWLEISDELKDKGFSLPPYLSSGAVYIPNDDLSPLHLVEFKSAWKEEKMVCTAIESLLDIIPGDGVPPLKQALLDAHECLYIPKDIKKWGMPFSDKV